MQVVLDLVKSLASFLANFLKFQWGKILFTLSCAILFFLFLFPYSDLTSFTSKFIFEQSGIATRSRGLGIKALPFPGARISELEIYISSPPLTVNKASIYPSLLSYLLYGDLFFSADVEKIFGGDIELSRSPGEKVPEKDHRREVYDINAVKIDLAQVLSFLKTNTLSPSNIPVQLRGLVSIISNVDVDLQYVVQPNAEFQITGENIVFPPQSVATHFGPIQFPEMSWKTVLIKGRMVGGEIVFEEAQLGQAGDPLVIKSKGRLSLTLGKRPNGAIEPRLGAYEFDTDISMTQSVEAVVGLLISPLAGNFKAQSSNGTRYLFRMNGTNFVSLPRTQSIKAF
jgi:hypothetical protein